MDKDVVFRKMKGATSAIFAFFVCPCHLPITLPFILSLTAGTAVGIWLANNRATIYIVSAVLFISGLVLAGKWLSPNDVEARPIDLKEKRSAGL